MDKSIIKYTQLIEGFIKKKITALEFESEYIDMFENEQCDLSEKEYIVLDALFYEVDAFCVYDDIRDENDLDEDGLRKAAQRALLELKAIDNQKNSLNFG